MAVKDNQSIILLSNLYEISTIEGNRGLGENLAPRISASGGTFDLYISDKSTPPASLAEMSLDQSNIGSASFISVPRYLAIVQNAGTITEVVITALAVVEDLGAIS